MLAARVERLFSVSRAGNEARAEIIFFSSLDVQIAEVLFAVAVDCSHSVRSLKCNKNLDLLDELIKVQLPPRKI